MVLLFGGENMNREKRFQSAFIRELQNLHDIDKDT